MIRKDIEREKEEFRKKDKNNRIILEKYKKESEELKMKLKLFSEEKKQETVCGVCDSRKEERKETYQRKTTARNKKTDREENEDYFEEQKKHSKPFDEKIKHKTTFKLQDENPF